MIASLRHPFSSVSSSCDCSTIYTKGPKHTFCIDPAVKFLATINSLNFTQQEVSILKTAIHAAKLAGRYILSQWGQATVFEIKNATPRDFATSVDKHADRIITEVISKRFPHEKIFSEETINEKPIEPDALQSGAWIVDSLDGTTNFMHQWPKVAVSICHFKHGKPDIAVVMNLPSQTINFAIKNKGSYKISPDSPSKYIRLSVKDPTSLQTSLLGTYTPVSKPTQNIPYLLALLPRTHNIKHETGAFDGGSIASGEINGTWQFETHPWDIAASSLILQEAGGIYTDVYGQPLDWSKDPMNFIAASPKLHQALVVWFAEIRLKAETFRKSMNQLNEKFFNLGNKSELQQISNFQVT